MLKEILHLHSLRLAKFFSKGYGVNILGFAVSVVSVKNTSVVRYLSQKICKMNGSYKTFFIKHADRLDYNPEEVQKIKPDPGSD